MRTWHSIRLSCLHATVATVLIGCGSDFGGDLGLSPPTTMPDGGAGNGADVAAQPETGAADGGVAMDGSGAPDLSTTLDVSAPPPPDAVAPDGASQPPDVSTPGDGSTPIDGPGLSDTSARDNAVDIRADAVVSRDTTVDTVDARVDTSVDASGIDSREAGPTGPRCGDGHKDPGEECDDGNTIDFDGCSSICTDRRACDCCFEDIYPPPPPDAGPGSLQVQPCKDIQGEASGGPKIGSPKAQLCQELYTCLLKSQCGIGVGGLGDQLMECYCGKGNVPDVPSTCSSEPKGPCVAEFEAGYEAEGATWQDRVPAIVAHLKDLTYAGGQVGQRWTAERGDCPLDCGTPPVWTTCVKPPDSSDAGGVSDANGGAAE